MFKAIQSAGREIHLFRLGADLIASTGAFLARARGGQLTDVREVRALVEGEERPIANLMRLAGRLPDAVWGIVDLGWKHVDAGRGGQLTPEMWHAAVRWDEAGGRFVEVQGLRWIYGFGGGVLANTFDRGVVWLSAPDRAPPAAFADGTLVELSIEPVGIMPTEGGDVFTNFASHPRLAPGWWLFRGGDHPGEQLTWPPEVDAKSISVAGGPEPGTYFVFGTLRLGAPFLAVRGPGRWQWLHPLPHELSLWAIHRTHAGTFIGMARSPAGKTLFLRFEGDRFQPLGLTSPFDLQPVLPGIARQGVETSVGPGEEIWVAVSDERGGSTLYHAAF